MGNWSEVKSLCQGSSRTERPGDSVPDLKFKVNKNSYSEPAAKIFHWERASPQKGREERLAQEDNLSSPQRHTDPLPDGVHHSQLWATPQSPRADASLTGHIQPAGHLITGGQPRHPCGQQREGEGHAQAGKTQHSQRGEQGTSGQGGGRGEGTAPLPGSLSPLPPSPVPEWHRS